MINLFKILRKVFRTVYCNECANEMDDTNIYGDKCCKAYPYKYNLSTTTLLKRGHSKIVICHEICKKVKKWTWCFRYREKK